MPAADLGIRPRLFYGWIVVATAFLVLFMAYGTQYAFGVFLAALGEEFGWSRASLSGVFSLYAFVYSVFALGAGRLTDRWGPRAVISVGGALLGIGLMLMSRVTALWQPYLLYGTVAALGMSTAYVPCNATVAKWFTRRRGIAVGLASAGGSLGTFALPPVAHLLVSHLGWRGAYVVFGAAVLVALNGLGVLMRRDPETMGLRPDGAPAVAASPRSGRRSGGWTVAEALRTRAFWMLYGVFAATWTPVFIPLVHLVPMARGFGIAPLLAATLVSAVGVAAMAGRLVMGAASDRIGRRAALAVAFVLQAGAFMGFSWSNELAALYAASVVFGFSYGAASALFTPTVADFFGREHAGSLAGLLFSLAGSMAACGPFAAGFIYDRAGDYRLAWWLSAACNGLALSLLAFTRPPAPRDEPAPA
ncbi:MAG TPA: MFS transporter [Methylomirabilota bacterium]|jgi:MFS family permease|nr:MFS transporter [Methylomirabilota bacterium]